MSTKRHNCAQKADIALQELELVLTFCQRIVPRSVLVRFPIRSKRVGEPTVNFKTNSPERWCDRCKVSTEKLRISRQILKNLEENAKVNCQKKSSLEVEVLFSIHIVTEHCYYYPMYTRHYFLQRHGDHFHESKEK